MAGLLNITIRSEEDAWNHLNRAYYGEYEGRSIVFSFDGWPNFNLEVEGDRYHSTLPSSLLKSLSNYQALIGRLYSSVAYNKSGKGLTDQDREDLELVFQIKDGCTHADANMSEAAARIGEKAVERMTGKELVYTTLGLAMIASLAWIGHSAVGGYFDSKAASANERVINDILKTNEFALATQRATSEFAMNLLKSVDDADHVQLGNGSFRNEDIRALTQKPKVPNAKLRIDGAYEITQLRRFEDKWKITIYSPMIGAMHAELFKGQSAASCMEEITHAFLNQEAVVLYVLGKFKSNELIGINILGTEKCGLLQISPDDDLLISSEKEDDDGED